MARFDLVVSSLAFHNIPTFEGRQQAIADFRETRRYGERLRELGMTDVVQHPLGWRFWYGGAWAATHLVSARKPG